MSNLVSILFDPSGFIPHLLFVPWPGPGLCNGGALLGQVSGDMHGPKPYELIGFGDMHGPKPYELIGFGDMHGPKPY